MTDRERYKRTFSKLHASEEILLEVNSMKKIKIMPIRRLAAIAAAAMLIAAMATVAYANDIGGIQNTIQILFKDGTLLMTDIQEITLDDGTIVKSAYFETVDTEFERDDVKIEVNYDGEPQAVYGYIVSGEVSEAMPSVETPEVEYRDDGTVWVHYNGKDIEITDLFEDGICHLELENEQVEVEDGEETKSVSLTIQYGESEGFASVDEFVSHYSATVE